VRSSSAPAAIAAAPNAKAAARSGPDSPALPTRASQSPDSALL
jgi:hypothetical protein